MVNYKDLATKGWHPKNEKGVRATVNGWRGKGDGTSEHMENHSSAPLSTLKDPAQFGPPPKHHAAQAASSSSSTTSSDPKPKSTSLVPKAPPPSTAYSRGGLGAPMASSKIQEQQEREAQEEAEASKPVAPPIPYRANTTGLQTNNLPKPPVKRADPQTESPATATSTTKPIPPSRLPPRQNSHPDEYAPPPPPSYGDATTPDATQQSEYINRGSADRLGRAGVAVPGFGIGQTSSPDTTASQAQQPAAPQSNSQMSELQARFARMGKSTNTDESPAPAQGTSWQQKQKAAQTASNFRKDPSSVSMADARDAASTANNFKQRHGDQISAGAQKANGLNQKYGLSNKVAGFSQGGSSTTQAAGSVGGATDGGSSAAAAAKKAPPPPPPKKKGLEGEPLSAGEPPPVPLASKPR